MAIYIHPKTGLYQYSVYVPGRATRLRGSCGTADRAEAELVERTVRLAAGRRTSRDRVMAMIEALYHETDADADAIPIRAIYAESMRVVQVDGYSLSKTTIRQRRFHLDAFARWIEANWPSVRDIRDVTRLCAQRYASYIASRPITVKTRRNIIGDLVTTWNQLARYHDGITNPWPLAMPRANDCRRGNAFGEDEVRRIYAAGDADGHGWGLAARIAAATGLRMGDVLTLRHEDIVDGAITISPRKTTRHWIRVTIPLPDDLLALIGDGSGYILPVIGGARYNAGHQAHYPFAAVLRAAGVDPRKYTFHSFRHYFRSRLAAAGVSDETAMRLGGWTQRDTASRYDHDDHRQELADAINAAWTGC